MATKKHQAVLVGCPLSFIVRRTAVCVDMAFELRKQPTPQVWSSCNVPMA